VTHQTAMLQCACDSIVRHASCLPGPLLLHVLEALRMCLFMEPAHSLLSVPAQHVCCSELGSESSWWQLQ
jgi:hypothetical protein